MENNAWSGIRYCTAYYTYFVLETKTETEYTTCIQYSILLLCDIEHYYIICSHDLQLNVTFAGRFF